MLLIDFIMMSLLTMVVSLFLKGDKLKAIRYSLVVYSLLILYFLIFVSTNNLMHILTLPIVVWNLNSYYKKELLKKANNTKTSVKEGNSENLTSPTLQPNN
jgi:Na+/melibiose symporter-like transporter